MSTADTIDGPGRPGARREAGDSPGGFGFRFRRAPGGEPVRLILTVHPEAGGIDRHHRQGCAWHGVAGDVSARRGATAAASASEAQGQALAELARDAIAESEQKFSRAFDSNPAVMAILSGEVGRSLDINAAFERISGYSREEVIGRCHEELGLSLHPEEVEAIGRALGEQGYCDELECTLRLQDGSLRTGLLSVSPFVVGGRSHFLVTMIDTTERRRAQKRLEESAESFRRLFEESGQAVALWDGRRFFDANQAAVDMLGLDCRQDMIGTTPADISPARQPDGRASSRAVHKTFARALVQGSHRFEWQLRRADGRLIGTEAVATPIHFGDQLILHVAWTDLS